MDVRAIVLRYFESHGRQVRRTSEASGRWSKLKSALANAALLTISIAVSYLVGGYLALRYYFPYQAPTLRSLLPDLPDIVGQTSKRNLVPRDFIAILGDSYAEGLGDWMIQSEARGTRRYHAAHVLQDLTGRDVISLGRWGYGSAQAMVLKPARAFFDKTCPALPSLERPSRIVVYLYEGNDLIDNYRWVELRVPAALTRDPSVEIDRYLNESYGVVAWWRCHTYFALAIRDMIKLAVARILPRRGIGPPATNADEALRQKSNELGPNRIVILDRVHPVQTLLGPSLHLSDRQLELASTVFRRSLSWLRSRFPDTPILIAYLPSPAVVYRFAGATVSVREGHSAVSRTFVELQVGSQAFCERFRAIALQQGAHFLDTRPALRAAARVNPVHGPVDWDHFNEAGYRALGQALAGAVDAPDDRSCAAWDGVARD